jgi:hypothetical protein
VTEWSKLCASALYRQRIPLQDACTPCSYVVPDMNCDACGVFVYLGLSQVFTLRYSDLEAMLVTLGVFMNDDGTVGTSSTMVSPPATAASPSPTGDAPVHLMKAAPEAIMTTPKRASSDASATSTASSSGVKEKTPVAYKLSEFTRIRVLVRALH